ncbi:DUF6705 family protein [uncultured Chryseobacterium sp.]|uniref:DUF6705 family protein n=1 Tax=uncultured Chryseobacterium sp. TaxID=259322 RepID=UPI0025DDC20B|nr:DUF6705 family protein [uncultured Chryseobacterium sp.]
MKNLFLIIILFTLTISCKAQTYPLRTFTQIPQNAYLKDTNNELQYYVGTWKGSWNNKTIYITLKKITNQYNTNLKYYKDFLIGKFKVEDSNGQILFDNTSTSDYDAKISGVGIRKIDDKYSLGYIDPDFCMDGSIRINFTDSTKTKLNWQFFDTTDIITPDCPNYNSNPFPEPLPKNIILTKQ